MVHGTLGKTIQNVLKWDNTACGKEQETLNVSNKKKKTKELIQTALDTFVEKGLTATTTKDLCTAAGLQNGGIYYYFDTKEEIIIDCAEAAIQRIEKRVFGMALDNIGDIEYMMNHLGVMAEELSPVMRFLVSVCASREYGEKVKPSLVRFAGRYPYYTSQIAEILGCTPQDIEPYVHLSILAVNNYMIFGERALFEPQIRAAQTGLTKLAQRN